MTGLEGWLSVSIALLGLLTLVSAAWAVIRSGYTSARADDAEKRISALRGEIDDKDRVHRDREADLLRHVEELSTRVTALEAANQTLASQNETLRQLVPSADQMAEIRRLQQRHYDEATDYISEARAQGAWVRNALSNVLDTIREALSLSNLVTAIREAGKQ